MKRFKIIIILFLVIAVFISIYIKIKFTDNSKFELAVEPKIEDVQSIQNENEVIEIQNNDVNVETEEKIEEIETEEKNVADNQYTATESVILSNNNSENTVRKTEEKVQTQDNKQATKVIPEKEKTKVENTLPQKQFQEATPKEPVVKKVVEKPKCTDTNHVTGVGNSGKWFNSQSEADNYYNSIIKSYSDKWKCYEITTEEYEAKCPYGFEVWSCTNCGKWTLNMFYN